MEPVPVLDTPQVAAHQVETVQLLMVTVSVVQTVMYMVTAVKMFTVL